MLAIAANIAVLFAWDAVKTSFTWWPAKWFMAGARALSALAAFSAHIAKGTPEEELLSAAALFAILSWALWESLQFLGDRGIKNAAKEADIALDAERLKAGQFERQSNIFSSM